MLASLDQKKELWRLGFLLEMTPFAGKLFVWSSLSLSLSLSLT